MIVGTDAGEWLAIEAVRDGTGVRRVCDTGPFAAVAREEAGLAIASWGAQLVRLRAGERAEGEPAALAIAALALVSTPRGLVIASVDGGLSLLANDRSVPVQELAAPAPIVEMLAHATRGLALLGAGGTLDVTTWPASPGPLVRVDPAAIGRPHALFAGMTPGTALVAGARGVAILDGTRLATAAAIGPDRVCAAVAFAGRGRACLCDDAGAAWIVDASLGRVDRVRLPDASFAGLAAGPRGAVLAWTDGGALYEILHDGESRRLAAERVVLALGRADDVIAIQWTAADGVSATATGRGAAWT